MNKFKVGDKVVVVDTGWSYTTYADWARRHGMTAYKTFDADSIHGLKAKVVAVGVHTSGRDDTIIAGIQADGGQQYIIGVKGLELVKPSIDFTKPVRTKSGDPVEIAITNGRGEFSVRGYIGESETLVSWMSNGSYFSDQEHANDLENIPVEHTFTLVLYRDGSAACAKDKSQLEHYLNTSSVVATKQITVTEGEYFNG